MTVTFFKLYISSSSFFIRFVSSSSSKRHTLCQYLNEFWRQNKYSNFSHGCKKLVFGKKDGFSVRYPPMANRRKWSFYYDQSTSEIWFGKTFRKIVNFQHVYVEVGISRKYRISDVVYGNKFRWFSLWPSILWCHMMHFVLLTRDYGSKTKGDMIDFSKITCFRGVQK